MHRTITAQECRDSESAVLGLVLACSVIWLVAWSGKCRPGGKSTQRWSQKQLLALEGTRDQGLVDS